MKFYDETGQRRGRWLEGHKTEVAAKRALRAALTAQEQHRWSPPAERLTLREYRELRWLPSLAGTHRASTVTSYTSHVRLSHMRLDQLTGSDLGSFYGWLRTEGG